MIARDATAPSHHITHIGRYRMVSKLGRGATAQVYLALDDKGQSVTIKLEPQAGVSESAMQRFRTEVDILSKLDHPGLPRLIDTGETEGLPIDIPYLVTEYIHGLPLDEFAACNKLDDKERLLLIAVICDTLQHLHDCSILHRDIKPSNIIITPEVRPVIIDFGYARLSSPQQYLQSPQPVGTTRYTSPESITASAPEGPPADVYSLAVVCYELLTGGQWPYPAVENTFTDRQIIESVLPTQLSALRPDLRGPLDHVFSCALAKDPRKRYASPRAFAADLHNYLAGHPIRARRITLRESIAHSWKHSRHAVMLIALLASLALTASIGWASAQRRTAELRRIEQDVAVLLASTTLDTPQGRADVAKQIASWKSQLVWSIYDAMGFKARDDARFAESLVWLEESKKWVVTHHGPNHQLAIRAEQLICETLLMSGRAPEAERILRATISRYVSAPNEVIRHNEVIRNRLLRHYWTLGLALEDQGNLQDAAELLEEVYELQSTHQHPDHTDKLETLKVLSRIQQSIGAQNPLQPTIQ